MLTQTKESLNLRSPQLERRTSNEEPPTAVLIQAVIALLFLVALFGLLIWLAAQSEPLDIPYEYWMP